MGHFPGVVRISSTARSDGINSAQHTDIEIDKAQASRGKNEEDQSRGCRYLERDAHAIELGGWQGPIWIETRRGSLCGSAGAQREAVSIRIRAGWRDILAIRSRDQGRISVTGDDRTGLCPTALCRRQESTWAIADPARSYQAVCHAARRDALRKNQAEVRTVPYNVVRQRSRGLAAKYHTQGNQNGAVLGRRTISMQCAMKNIRVSLNGPGVHATPHVSTREVAQSSINPSGLGSRPVATSHGHEAPQKSKCLI